MAHRVRSAMRRRLTGLFLLTGVATACGRLASQQGDAGAFDGSPEIDASSDADAAYAAFYGTVSVEVQPQTNGRYGGWDAVFIPWNKPLPTAGVTSCDGVLLGGCCYSKITKGTTPTEPSGGLFPTPDGVSAGTVSILNQTEQLQPITREFDAGGYFPSPSDSWD